MFLRAFFNKGEKFITLVLLFLGSCSNPTDESYFQYRKTTGSPINVGSNVTIKNSGIYEKITSVNIISTKDVFEAEVGLEILGAGSNDWVHDQLKLYSGPEYVGIFIDWNKDGNYARLDDVAGVSIFRVTQVPQTVTVKVVLRSTIQLNEVSNWNVYAVVVYGQLPQFENSPSYEFRYGDAKLAEQVQITPPKEGPLELLDRVDAKLSEKLNNLSGNAKGRTLLESLLKDTRKLLNKTNGVSGLLIGLNGRRLRSYLSAYSKTLDKIKADVADKLGKYFSADEISQINNWIDTQKIMIASIPQIGKITTDYHGVDRKKHIAIGFKRNLALEILDMGNQPMTIERFPDYAVPVFRNCGCEGLATADTHCLQNFG